MPAGFAVEHGHGLGGAVWASGRPARCDDFAADPRFNTDRYLPIVRADRIVSCMAVPIATDGVVVGVIYANNFTLRPFTDADEAALATLADHAAVAVQKARLLAAEHAARGEAEAASRGKDELLGQLGHELRNPPGPPSPSSLNVLGAALAAPRTSVRRAREWSSRARTPHLARLVDDLLDVARVDVGQDRPRVGRPLELAEAVRRGIGTSTASGSHSSITASRVDTGRTGVGPRGRDTAGAGRHQPRRQCPPLHAGRREHRCEPAGRRRWPGRLAGARLGRRHRAGRPRPRVRHVRAGHPRPRAWSRRARARAHPGATDRGAPRRQRRGRQRGARVRQPLHRPPALHRGAGGALCHRCATARTAAGGAS